VSSRVTQICPQCHQPVRHARAGVYLSVRKAAIFYAIKRAGDLGVTSDELIGALYDHRVSRNAIKAHVGQINGLLEETPYIIRSDRCRWYLARRFVRRVA
jgi:hypothetical protein